VLLVLPNEPKAAPIGGLLCPDPQIPACACSFSRSLIDFGAPAAGALLVDEPSDIDHKSSKFALDAGFDATAPTGGEVAVRDGASAGVSEDCDGNIGFCMGAAVGEMYGVRAGEDTAGDAAPPKRFIGCMAFMGCIGGLMDRIAEFMGCMALNAWTGVCWTGGDMGLDCGGAAMDVKRDKLLAGAAVVAGEIGAVWKSSKSSSPSTTAGTTAGNALLVSTLSAPNASSSMPNRSITWALGGGGA